MIPALHNLEGKYEIVSKIKEGGMGAIYKVRHRLLEEIRVVKVLRRHFEDDAELNARFVHEARSAIRLRHPNVVQIFDFLLEEGVGYLVMEYIDGVDLGELIQRRQRPSLPLFLEIARQSLRALGYLHQQGYVHRDVSPDNLMLCCDFAGRPLVKMIDLGIARKVEGGAGLTASGMFLGKFRYSSPEHFGSQGAGGVEPRSDLYSFGIVLYELLTGSFPIRGETEPQLIAGHLFHPPVEFAESDPDGRVPKALREALVKTLDKDPAKRFASADELARALRGLQDQFPLNDAALAEAKTISVGRAEEQQVDPGSTQDRLDRGFVHPTPAPSAVTAPDGFDHHLRVACTLAEEGSYADAIAHFEAALELQPGNEAVLGMLDEAREKLAEERRVTQERLAGEVRQLRELVAGGELEKARERLLSARRAYGDAEPLAEVQLDVERREAARERRRVEETVEEAEGLREAGDFTLAAQALERAREIFRGSPIRDADDGRDLRDRLEREEASLEQDLRRAAELDEAIYAIETAVAKGRLTEADRVLYQALETFGRTEPRLQGLRERLDELHHQGLEKQVATLLAEVDELARTGDFSAARKRLDKARVAAPAGSAARDRIEERAEAVRQVAARRREDDVAAAARRIEELVARDELEQAQAELAASEARLGEPREAETERFAVLRERIAEGFQERVNALIQEARVALEGQRFEAAVPFLEQALELAPGDEWIAARLAQARAALGRA
jgi:serine/threonine-protein kinase